MPDLPTTGYPIDLHVDYVPDGPLILNAPEGQLTFAVEGGVVSASTQARAAALVRYVGASPTVTVEDPAVPDAENTPPAGSGDQPPSGGAKRSRRTPAPSTDPEG